MLHPLDEVLKWIKPSDRVLDVGGGAIVFPRANAVIDVIPYEARQPAAERPSEPELFGPQDWYVGDICDGQVWSNFRDKQFDFIVCSHTLEDIRDPIFVCKQMLRIGKAGYIETPSMFRECAKHDANALIVGWEHHRWLMYVEDGKICFTLKQPYLHHFDFAGDKRRAAVFDYFNNYTGVHWEGSFDFVERQHKGSPLDVENMFYYFDTYDYSHPKPVLEIINVPYRGITFEADYQLPVEKVLSPGQAVERFNQRLKNPDQPLPPFPGLEGRVDDFTYPKPRQTWLMRLRRNKRLVSWVRQAKKNKRVKDLIDSLTRRFEQPV